MATTAADGNSGSDVIVVVEKKSQKMITLISSDGEQFDVTEAAAGMSQTIAHMIEDDCVDHGVPLQNVHSKILAKVIKYCNKHAVVVQTGSDSSNDDGNAGSSAATADQAAKLKSFDLDFVKVDIAMLFDIVLAANYLDIKGLLDLTCQAVADHIKDKSVKDVRELFNIVNDFTKEEEAKIQEENKWAFE